VEAVFDPGGGAPPVALRAGPAGGDGRFSLAGAPAKWTSLRIRARRGPLAVEADLGDAPGPLSLDLRLPATFTAAGIVIAEEDGRPLPGMDVRMGERSARTDPLGRFSLGDIPAPPRGGETPALEISGAGRKTLRRALPLDRGADDLLLRVERE
jgi:hypothetical protein